MASRTYIPQLRIVLRIAHRYGTRYQDTLANTLTAPQYTCLLSVINAIADCLALLEEPVPEPPA